MSVLVTSTPSLEEQMQELQRKLAEKETEIANLITQLENREHKKIMRLAVAPRLSFRKISRSR